MPPESRSTGVVAPVAERHQLQQLVGAAGRLVAGDREVAREDEQVLADGELQVERRLLRHHAEHPLQLARALVGVEAEHLAGSPRVAGREAREHPHRAGLPRPVRPEEAEALARGRSLRSMPSTAVKAP